MVNVSFARELIEQLDGWVNDLAAPLQFAIERKKIPWGASITSGEIRCER